MACYRVGEVDRLDEHTTSILRHMAYERVWRTDHNGRRRLWGVDFDVGSPSRSDQRGLRHSIRGSVVYTRFLDLENVR